MPGLNNVMLKDRPQDANRDLLLALGESLRLVRELYGWSRAEALEAAAQADLPYGSITEPKLRKWENGQNGITLPDLILLSEVYGPFWTWPVPKDPALGQAMRDLQDVFA